MYLRMAVEAAPALSYVDVAFAAGRGTGTRPWQGSTSEGGNIRSVWCVARVAQEGRPHLEHAFCGGAMRIVAIAAVFIDGLVVVHKGPAFFHMAGVAGVVYAVALHQLGAYRAMRVVAIGAGHFSLGYRVVRGAADLCTLLFVAHLVMRSVNFMAAGTGNIAALVCAALPVRALSIAVVAGEAGFILYPCLTGREGMQCTFFGFENDINRSASICGLHAFQVIFTQPVARLAGG